MTRGGQRKSGFHMHAPPSCIILWWHARPRSFKAMRFASFRGVCSVELMVIICEDVFPSPFWDRNFSINKRKRVFFPEECGSNNTYAVEITNARVKDPPPFFFLRHHTPDVGSRGPSQLLVSRISWRNFMDETKIRSLFQTMLVFESYYGNYQWFPLSLDGWTYHNGSKAIS